MDTAPSGVVAPTDPDPAAVSAAEGDLQREAMWLRREESITSLIEQMDEDFRNVVASRKEMKWYLYWLMVVWLLLVMGVVVFNQHCGLKVDDGVLIALVTGAAAQLIGLFLVVAQYLFPKDGASISPQMIKTLDELLKSRELSPTATPSLVPTQIE